MAAGHVDIFRRLWGWLSGTGAQADVGPGCLHVLDAAVYRMTATDAVVYRMRGSDAPVYRMTSSDQVC